MSGPNLRAVYGTWPRYNRALRDTVAALTEEQLAVCPGPGRWPLWATVGHTACQRVSWLCGFAGEPGAETTPFPDALHTCPGDEDLEHVLGPEALAAALDSTFGIVEGCLDRWTVDMLGEEIRRTFGTEEWVHTRGWVIERVFAHDVYHCAELNEALGVAGLPQIDLWG
ncbi:MAG: DinB family protein [Acidimicrobiia bacterium]|nr:DinB family protein [Acidimicrobiia bacterium]